MFYLTIELCHRWSALGFNVRGLSIIYLALYPVPWLFLLKKADPFVVAGIIYGILGIAAFLVDPMAR
jgi:hypothetical protein